MTDYFKCISYKDFVKQCEMDMKEILSGTISKSPLDSEQKVRVAAPNDKFYYLNYGEFFFFGGDTMYMFVDEMDEQFEYSKMNKELLEELMDSYKAVPTLLRQRQQIVRVYYAGLETGMADARHNILYEGDIVHDFSQVLVNHEKGRYARIAATKDGFVVKSKDFVVPIDEAYKSYLVGSAFINIDPSDTEFDYEKELSFLDGEHSNDELNLWLLLHQHTPSLKMDLWCKAENNFLHF